MSEHHVGQIKGLPENAYQELKAGEEYKPLMPASSTPQEITPYSVIMGLLMAVLFSAAAAYLGLKIGQVFEAAIPIAIIAVGVSSLFKIKGSLGQNVIIQSIGQNSGLIVAGAIFTIPALHILNLETHFYQLFSASAFGEMLADKFKLVFRLNVGSAVVGLGYIVGLKYAALICAGSFVSWYLLIPVI